MALFRKNPVRIQPYFGYRSAARLVLKARALRSDRPTFNNGGRWQAIRTMLAQFTSRKAQGVEVTLHIARPDGLAIDLCCRSDSKGYVCFELELDPSWQLPDHPAWEAVHLRWTNENGPQSIAAYVLTPGQISDLAVISDIDDTIIETGITGGLASLLRNWRRILAQWPDERIAVADSDVFYSALGGGTTSRATDDNDGILTDGKLADGDTADGACLPATHRPFFYVSSSPWNLYSYLVAFLHAKQLPLGPLLLREWGLNRTTLGGAGHGAHKVRAVTEILQMYPDMRFALIGDDTQGDLSAFADAVEQFPDRIAAVFLRRIADEPLSPKEQRAAALIERAGVHLWMGAAYSQGHEFLETLGFTPGGETQQIVHAVTSQDASDASADLQA